MWKNIKTVFQSATNVIVVLCTTTEKSVQLVEAEVDILKEVQNIRISSTKTELATLISQAQLEQS